MKRPLSPGGLSRPPHKPRQLYQQPDIVQQFMLPIKKKYPRRKVLWRHKKLGGRQGWGDDENVPFQTDGLVE